MNSPRMELSQRFYFEAAHTLAREVDAAGSARVHGHTWYAEVTIKGAPAEGSGMVVDLVHVRRALSDLKDRLDHQFLNDLEGLGAPTLENLCIYISKFVRGKFPSTSSVKVWREASGDSCMLRLAE